MSDLTHIRRFIRYGRLVPDAGKDSWANAAEGFTTWCGLTDTQSSISQHMADEIYSGAVVPFADCVRVCSDCVQKSEASRKDRRAA